MDIVTLNESGQPVLNIKPLFSLIKRKLGKNPYDFADQEKSFEKWKNSLGYGDYDDDGIHCSSSQTLFRKYKEDPKGYLAQPPRQNYFKILTLWANHPIQPRGKLPKTINFFKMWKRLKVANGVESPSYKAIIWNIIGEATHFLDMVDAAAIIHSYDLSLKEEWELQWAIDLTDTIMEWIGPAYWNKNLIINYN